MTAPPEQPGAGAAAVPATPASAGVQADIATVKQGPAR